MVKECITSELMEKTNNENNQIKRMKGRKNHKTGRRYKKHIVR